MNKYPQRKDLRLKEYDYSQEGAYFITICTCERENYFEIYPALRKIIHEQWFNLFKRFNCLALDKFIVMPNHVHGIIFIDQRSTARGAPTIGGIVGAYKSLCVREWSQYIQINQLKMSGKFWQRGFYDHIIRNGEDLNRVREYIDNNILQWALDDENLNKQMP